MTSLVKIHHKGQMTLPSRLRSAIGIAEGDLVEASVQRGKIVLTPKLAIGGVKVANADSEYTREQRSVIDARLAKARKGPYHGPFDTADEAIQFLHKEIRSRKATKRKTTKL
ncbi:MAG: AbrB/MazE/SpoVT family DNA-binding domain-containing protein [Bryobacteraceae bacterium]|jgi:AbrB family looped-hinge helix DNA binding protein